MKRTHRLLVVGALVVTPALALTPPAAAVLADGSYHCNLTGGNSIVVDFQLTQQGSPPTSGFFALTGQWDDASLTPLLPIFGAAVFDLNFDVVGGFTFVGFRPNTPLLGAPFGSWPAGVHVQFRLEEVPAAPAVAYRGRWADNRGNFGRMACTFTP